MKTLSKLITVPLCVFVMAISSLSAQDLGYYIEGEALGVNIYPEQSERLSALRNVAFYRVEVEFDTSVAPTASTNPPMTLWSIRTYYESITTIRAYFWDAQGVPLSSEFFIPFDAATATFSQTYNESLLLISGGDLFDNDRFYASASQEVDGINSLNFINFYSPDVPIHATFEPYPQLLNTNVVAGATLSLMNGTAEESFELVGNVNSIGTYFLSSDADGDGILDEVDLCTASVVAETVSFSGWLDSGVTNYVDADGCTIMDHYAVCLSEEQEQPAPRFSSMLPRLSGPSYCETQVSYNLLNTGVIDYTEARMLRDALYMSYRSGAR
ncbi:hypothetical protein IDAT_10385 [Pseudidiomarina atlantica]|uniref:EF-hand domain-containing protein n=1 Tax=Pseudidiomarina atlantica TaxID=1517416 RepID=A0A094IQV3_9GAMM|nr:hypothetical protein [Pseudidiomarina atlantica]KFZ28229.1 hypothetical protein IDAT_10385 [Pseudidiomarina atlantica]